ncbi:SIMPL domain-containing protein [Halobacteriales archaeon QS_1_68_20]|nr:MAG: SIMPL domain-containing protein [Halobacteriales archaeon QS_1_68_20]
MRRRTFLTAAGTGTVTALAGCTAGADDEAPTGTDRTGGTTGDPETLIRVAASGEVETDPDLAEVYVGVVATGQDAATVRDELSSRAEDVKNALLDAGIPEENVRTVQFEIEEAHREEGSGLRGEHVYEVEVGNVDRVGEIVNVAVDAGAEDVGRIRFTLAEETADELRDTALRQALENARGEAETIADAEGLAITGVEEVATTRTDVRAAHAEAADAGDGGTEIDAGPVTVAAQVEATYGAAVDG